MKFLFTAALLLASAPAFAETYHLAACDLAKSGNGWTSTGAVDGTREAVDGVMVKVAQVTSDSGGYCNLLRGTGDEASADLLLNSASGSGISVSPSCEFRGQVRDANTARKTLAYGDSVTVDYGQQQREGVYFASPTEASDANWVSAACEKLAASLGGSVRIAHNACKLPKDQGEGSLHGGWKNVPIPLVLDREFYRHGEAMALKRAVATWNRALGRTIFVIRQDGQGSEIPAVTDCSQASYTAAMQDAVGVWRIDGITAGRANQRPSCGLRPDGVPGKLLASGVQGQTDWRMALGKIQGASVLLNLDDYNRPGRSRLDLESEMLHELGHVLGLLHSCNGSSASVVDSTTAPACFTDGVLTAPKAYTDAVMFPFLQDGQVKRTLGENDLARAACLY